MTGRDVRRHRFRVLTAETVISLGIALGFIAAAVLLTLLGVV